MRTIGEYLVNWPPRDDYKGAEEYLKELVEVEREDRIAELTRERDEAKANASELLKSATERTLMLDASRSRACTETYRAVTAERQAAAMQAALGEGISLFEALVTEGLLKEVDEVERNIAPLRAALASDAGRGWVPREKAVELARRAYWDCAHEEAADGTVIKGLDALVAEVLGNE